MKASELRQKNVEDLRKERLDLLREQFNLRMQKATGQLNKHHQFRQIGRAIARINTILGEKSKAGSEASEA